MNLAQRSNKKKIGTNWFSRKPIWFPSSSLIPARQSEYVCLHIKTSCLLAVLSPGRTQKYEI